jgi:hypothetical protein
MKHLLVAALLCALGGISARAHAQNYPWCADYGGEMGGSSNCGFVTYAQCMATLSGMGGFCDRNTQYVPPPGAHHPALAYRSGHRKRYQHP